MLNIFAQMYYRLDSKKVYRQCFLIRDTTEKQKANLFAVTFMRLTSIGNSLYLTDDNSF